jgi:V8-like Glu-specific endopeptidase
MFGIPLRMPMPSFWLLLASALTVAAGSDAQALTIDNLQNKKTVESRPALDDAEALPSPEFTPAQIDEMRRRFLEAHPEKLENSTVPSEPSLGADGVPTAVDKPADHVPFKSAGKLIFSTDTGKIASCTAQFLDDLNVILTAAHCVRNPSNGNWFGSFTFQRAYDNGNSAQTVGWKCLSVYREFTSPSVNAAYDYAFILADAPSTGGGLTMATGTPAEKPLTAIGYPTNYGNGMVMYQVTGEWASESGGIVTMKNNPMRHGNSGGAWFSKFKVDGDATNNLVVSLNSHHATGNTKDENGPLFTADTTALHTHVKNAGCMN